MLLKQETIYCGRKLMSWDRGTSACMTLIALFSKINFARPGLLYFLAQMELATYLKRSDTCWQICLRWPLVDKNRYQDK